MGGLKILPTSGGHVPKMYKITTESWYLNIQKWGLHWNQSTIDGYSPRLNEYNAKRPFADIKAAKVHKFYEWPT